MDETSGLEATAAARPGEIVVATYNVEALFDTKKDAGKNDHEFLPQGWWNWTEEKLARKLGNVSRVIRAINAGRGPDILALNEVENRPIVERLRDELLGDLGYQTLVHRDTACFHGLDHAVLSRYPLAREAKLHPMHVAGTEPEKRPRGVLEVALDVDGVPLTLFVNHWPAGSDGRARSQRRYVARRLRELIAERLAADPAAELIVLGDFNASPGDEAFGATGLTASADAGAVAHERTASVYNTLAEAAGAKSLPELDAALARHGERLGTHHTRPWPYTGKEGTWNAFDQIFIAAGLLDTQGLSWVPGSTQVLRESFMLTADGIPKASLEPGVDPRKQELDRMGFSDHLPLVTRLARRG